MQCLFDICAVSPHQLQSIWWGGFAIGAVCTSCVALILNAVGHRLSEVKFPQGPELQ